MSPSASSLDAAAGTVCRWRPGHWAGSWTWPSKSPSCAPGSVVNADMGDVPGWAAAVLLAAPLAYETVAVAVAGQTLGKRMTDCRVVSRWGDRVRWVSALVRVTVAWLPVLLSAMIGTVAPEWVANSPAPWLGFVAVYGVAATNRDHRGLGTVLRRRGRGSSRSLPGTG